MASIQFAELIGRLFPKENRSFRRIDTTRWSARALAHAGFRSLPLTFSIPKPTFAPVTRISTIILAAGLTFGAPAALAADDDAPEKAAAPKPAVVRIDDHTLRIGKITFRPDTREIRIPTQVNMTEGLLEFVLVRTAGKVHESLLVTEASGTNINVALKLLHYKASEELFPLFNENGSLSNKLPKVPENIRKAARTQISVEWKDGQKLKSAPLNKWVAYAATETAVPMPVAPWVYGGSYVLEGKFAADTTGDLVAIFTTRNALLNYAGTDHDNDDVWIPTDARVPPPGTDVTLVIAPYTGPPPKTAPSDSAKPEKSSSSKSSSKKTKP